MLIVVNLYRFALALSLCFSNCNGEGLRPKSAALSKPAGKERFTESSGYLPSKRSLQTTPTSAPQWQTTTFAEVSIDNTTQYPMNDTITVSFNYDGARFNDWIAMYDASTSSFKLGNEYHSWQYTCGSSARICMTGTADLSLTSAPGFYRIHLVRSGTSPPYKSLGNTNSFEVVQVSSIVAVAPPAPAPNTPQQSTPDTTTTINAPVAREADLTSDGPVHCVKGSILVLLTGLMLMVVCHF